MNSGPAQQGFLISKCMAEKNFILFEDECRDDFLPFTFTRPVCELRIGILTIRDKWQRSLNARPSYLTQRYLSEKYPAEIKNTNWLINGCVLPDPRLVAQVNALLPGEAIAENDRLIAACISESIDANDGIDTGKILSESKLVPLISSARMIRKLTDIFTKASEALRDDYKLMTYKRRSATIYESNRVINRNDIFIEEGAKVEFAYLNASKGPIFIGRNAEVMEGAMIRGPFALGEHSEVRMGSKIYYPTSIGPHCKVGGEINSSVMFGYSNKAHDGYLGHSVIGEWCNLGADTNNSNLKNDYGEVKLWDYASGGYKDTGLFNTGSVVGVFVNVFGAEFPEKFIPSFSWGSPSTGFKEYRIDKALEVARRVAQRKGVDLTPADEHILRYIHELENKKKLTAVKR